MTLTNARGKVVGSLTAPAGSTVSGSALLLRPGSYRLDFEVLGKAGARRPTVSYALRGKAISAPATTRRIGIQSIGAAVTTACSRSTA